MLSAMPTNRQLGAITLLDATDALAIPGGLSHEIHNPGSEDAELIICYSTGDREYTPESTVKNV